MRALPKAELHLHLEGTVSPETLVELSQRHDDDELTLAEARSLYRYTDFTGFLLAFKAVSERLRTAADYELITYRMLERLAAQGVVHAEAYVSVGVVYYWRRIEFEALFHGMEAARVRAERQFGITLYWIFDAVRHFGPEEAARVFRKAAELRRGSPSIVGIGIGGDERRAGAEPFRELFQEARRGRSPPDRACRRNHGTGEHLGGAQHWCGAHRPCPFRSTGSGPDGGAGRTPGPRRDLCHLEPAHRLLSRLEEHPVRRYFDAGLMVTLNSDDPAMFLSDLQDEYRLAHDCVWLYRGASARAGGQFH